MAHIVPCLSLLLLKSDDFKELHAVVAVDFALVLIGLADYYASSIFLIIILPGPLALPTESYRSSSCGVDLLGSP